MAKLNNINKNAVLYARVSTEEQATRDNSIPAQINAIKKYACSNNIEIVKEYVDEGKSARTADRPQFQHMISDAKKKDKTFSLILIHKTDRFARNRSDSVIYKSLLQKECGVDVISITELFDDSPTGKLLEGMMEVIAEFHSLNLAQEVMKGLKQKAGTGSYLGRVPFGYNLNNDTKRLLINDTEAEIVKMIYQMYSNGDSLKTIKTYLNNSGIFTRENKAWDSTGIKRIITNPVYIGQYTWNKTKRANNKVKDESEWIVIKNTHDNIIENELFEKVQKILKSKSYIVGPSVKSPYILTPMIKCGHCGSKMIGHKQKYPNGRTYFRYVCSNFLYHRLCFYNFVHKDAIENLVFNEIRKIIITGKVDLDNIVITKSDNSTAEIDLLHSNLKKIKNKFKRQLEAYEAGVIALDELQEAKKRVTEEEDEIKLEIEKLEKKKQQDDISLELKKHFNGVEDILALNKPNDIKLWLSERIYSIEVFNKTDIVIKYKLSW